jgi:hypothetical protein
MLASDIPANISVCRAASGEGQVPCADLDTDRVELRQEGYEFEEVNELSASCEGVMWIDSVGLIGWWNLVEGWSPAHVMFRKAVADKDIVASALMGVG